MEATRIDTKARERAEGWIAELGQRIGDVEAALATLDGFLDQGTPGAAVIGSLKEKASEVCEQIPAVRQAVRDMDPSICSFCDGRGWHWVEASTAWRDQVACTMCHGTGEGAAAA